MLVWETIEFYIKQTPREEKRTKENMNILMMADKGGEPARWWGSFHVSVGNQQECDSFEVPCQEWQSSCCFCPYGSFTSI